MAITNGYATVIDYKLRFFPIDVTDPFDDQAIESIIEAISRLVDERCGRFFYSLAATALYFTAEAGDELVVPDLVSVTSIVTDEDGDRTYERTWAATDYDLEPFNAATFGKPYTRITVTPQGNYSFPTVAKGVKVTGSWGWPAVPKLAKEATLLQAFRHFSRKGAPFGVAGSAELGQLMVITRLDPDVEGMLEPLRRY